MFLALLFSCQRLLFNSLFMVIPQLQTLTCFSSPSEMSCNFIYGLLKCVWVLLTIFYKWQPFPKGEQISRVIFQCHLKAVFKCKYNCSHSFCFASHIWPKLSRHCQNQNLLFLWQWLFIFVYTILWVVLELCNAQVQVIRESCFSIY